jgi:hypothetical protein
VRVKLSLSRIRKLPLKSLIYINGTQAVFSPVGV